MSDYDLPKRRNSKRIRSILESDESVAGAAALEMCGQPKKRCTTRTVAQDEGVWTEGPTTVAPLASTSNHRQHEPQGRQMLLPAEILHSIDTSFGVVGIVAAGGVLYITTSGRHDLVQAFKISEDGGLCTLWKTSADGVCGLAIASHEGVQQLIIASDTLGDDAGLCVFSLDGTLVDTIRVAGMRRPNSIAVAGDLLYVVTYDGCIHVISRASREQVSVWLTHSDMPSGIVVIGDECFIGARNNREVRVFTTAGRFLRSFSVPSGPCSIHESGGLLFLGNLFDRRMTVYTPRGRLVDSTRDFGSQISSDGYPTGAVVVGSTVYVTLHDKSDNMVKAEFDIAQMLHHRLSEVRVAALRLPEAKLKAHMGAVLGLLEDTSADVRIAAEKASRPALAAEVRILRNKMLLLKSTRRDPNLQQNVDAMLARLCDPSFSSHLVDHIFSFVK